MQVDKPSTSTVSVSQLRSRGLLFAITLVVIGGALGLLSLAWMSNQFGNTDWFGLLLFPLASGIFVTGIVNLFFRLSIAILAGVVAVPISAVLPFVLYWCYFFGYSFHNRHHDDFAANGVSLIQPAMEMESLYGDCCHYISYGENRVPLFNSAAYFGGRYELKMQVPVKIQSETSGYTIGEPKFYLHEVSVVDISPSGQIGASFSNGVNFRYDEWQKVYNSDGDFSSIGFAINPTGVPDFQKYADVSRRGK